MSKDEVVNAYNNSMDQTEQNIEQLEKAFEGKLDLMLFYVTWIKNNLNATAAYRELHKNITVGSAEVLGSRMLGKVKEIIGLQAVVSVHGLDLDLYFKQLKEGVNAKGVTKDGIEFDDHRARRPYHETLGKLLGVEDKEKEQDNQYTQWNILNINKEEVSKMKQSFKEWMLHEGYKAT